MSKHGLNRTALFSLSSEGFSIHTFELSQQCSSLAWHAIKDKLYQEQESQKQEKDIWIYKQHHGRHVCTKFSEHGVRITLEHNECSSEYHTYFVRMVINPRKLLDPASSYLGILEPSGTSVKQINHAFDRLFLHTPFEEGMDVYLLTRLDLCTNIYCDQSNIFREFIRASQRLPTPPKLERKWYMNRDKGKEKRYNKHYIRYACGQHETVLYDKTFQIKDNKLALSYEKLPAGVLRYELRLNRAFLLKWAKHEDIESSSDLLSNLIANSRPMLTAHLLHCYPRANFYRLPDLIAQINGLSVHAKTKAYMAALVEEIHQGATADEALIVLEQQGADAKSLLRSFSDAGLSPVPLRKNFCAKMLPNPTELLCQSAKKPLPVAYIRSK